MAHSPTVAGYCAGHCDTSGFCGDALARRLLEATAMLRLCTILALVGTAGMAHALKPGKHADLLLSACRAAGMSREFCTRASVEDYTTDANEWEDLHAHAQIDSNETACTAADGAAMRLYELGQQLRGELASVARAPGYENTAAAASALGRAVHTIQDNCAHHGMPNPQHAWFSLSDFCDGTQLSPDIQGDAIACAKTETEIVMHSVAAAVRSANLDRTLDHLACPQPASDSGAQNPCQARFLPSPHEACEFMSIAKQWDGVDRTWNQALVAPALRDAFVAGLEGRAAPRPLCDGDESRLAPARTEAVVDVAGGAPSCGAAQLLCLGKVDGPNPFDDDEAETETGGCTSGRGHGVLLLLGIATWLVCRQRAAR